MSTTCLSDKTSTPSPSIRVIGFRNFIPAFDMNLTKENPKSPSSFYEHPKSSIHLNENIRTPDAKNLTIKMESGLTFNSYTSPRYEEPPRLLPMLEEVKRAIPYVEEEIEEPVLKVYEAGPFLVFTYSEFMRKGHYNVIDNLDQLEVDNDIEDFSPSNELICEDSFFKVKVKDNEPIYCVSKQQMTKKMENYSLNEENWRESGMQNLNKRINEIRSLLSHKEPVQEDLVLLGIVSQSLFGNIQRAYCKHKKSFYAIKSVPIKSVETLTLIFQELDTITRIIENDLSNHFVSVSLIENPELECTSLRVVMEMGLGTLEEFSLYKHQINEEWDEEDLMRIVSDLLYQNSALKNINASIKGIRPSNIVIYKEPKRLQILDYCIASLSSDEIAGIPKYMSPETFNNLKNFNVESSELYSIGQTIVSLLHLSIKGEEISSTKIQKENFNEIIKEKYPKLWSQYLNKLFNSQNIKKEDFQETKNPQELSFLRRNAQGFESFIAQREFGGKTELISDFDSFLGYFWQVKNFTLIDEIVNYLIEQYSSIEETSFRRMIRFLDKVVSLYESENSHERLSQLYERFLAFFEDQKGKATSKEHKGNLENLIRDLYSKIGDVYKLQDNYNKALENYEKALYLEYLKDSEGLYGFKNHFEIAEVYEKLGHDDLALDTYFKIQKKFKENFGEQVNQAQEGLLHERIGTLYFKKNKLAHAIEEIQKAISSYLACYGQYHGSVGNCERKLGEIYLKKGDQEEATAHFEAYFGIHLRGSGKYDMEAAKLMEQIGDYYKENKMYSQAIENYQRGLVIYEYHDVESILYSLYEKLAECYAEQKKYMMAVKTLRLCYKIKAAQLEEEGLELVPVIEKIAEYLIQDGEHKEALKEYSKALSIAMENKPSDDPLVTGILQKIGKISPLAFLSYKNYTKTNNNGNKSFLENQEDAENKNVTLLLSLNQLEDVRGVLGGLDLGMTLQELRSMISKECGYLKYFKYEFSKNDEVVDVFYEKQIKLEECVIIKEGFNYLLIREGKNVAKGRMTF